MATYDLGRAVVRIEIDRAGLRAGMAAAHAETAAEVAKMQRDVNAGTSAMGRDFDRFASGVRNSMARTTASVETGTTAALRKLDQLTTAAHRAEMALNGLADSGGSMARDLAADYEAAAMAADHSADEQIDSIHRIEMAMAKLRAAEAGSRGEFGGGGRRVFVGGPSGSQFVGRAGDNTVSLDAAQYAGLIAAIRSGGGGGGTTIIPTGGGGGGSAAGSASGGGTLSALLLGHGLTRNLRGPLGIPLPILGAGLGSVGSFAGLGMEHFLMTLLGLGGSAVGGAAGAGALAGGSLAKMLVGTGSDIAAFKTAQININNTTTAIDNYRQAVATFGKQSTEAQRAQAQMNFAIKDMPKQLQAQNLAISKANLALESYWKQASAGAVMEANNIIMQGQRLVHEYIPLVGQAAKENLTLINQGLKPLFAWLEGPNGVAIFNDLEMQFKQELPTAMHAFDQGAEFMLRLLDQASHYTGGFVGWLDKLFTHLNNLSNAQIDNGLRRVITMFDQWKNLIKVLVVDIDLLFRNDAGTSRGIVLELTRMLQKVGDWERTIHAQEQIHSIFQTHKEEIIAIIHTLGLLAGTFTKLYLTLGPPFTKMFTTLLNGVNGLFRALEKLPGGTWVLGLTLLSSKLLGISKTIGFIRSGMGAFLTLLSKMAGTGGAANALGGLGNLISPKTAGKTAASSAERGVVQEALPGLEAGGGGFLASLAGSKLGFLKTAADAGKSFLGDFLGALGPWAGLVGAMFGISQIVNAGGVKPITARQLHIPMGAPGGPSESQIRQAQFSDPLGNLAKQAKDLTEHEQKVKRDAAALQQWDNTARNSNKVGQMSTQQLAAFIQKGKDFANEFPRAKSVIDKLIPSLLHLHSQMAQVETVMNRHWADAGIKSVKNLSDAFNTNMRYIARVVGLNSAEGKRLMDQNVNQMIANTLKGMDKGKIGVKAGMAAIERSIDVGMKNGATTATQATTRMVNTLKSLYNHGKINATAFGKDLVDTFSKYSQRGANVWDQGTTDILHSIATLRNKGKITAQAMMDDVNSIWKSGVRNLNRQTDSWYNTQRAYYENLRKKGVLTQKEFNSDIATLEQSRNSRSKGNIEAWAQNILNGMVASGKISLSGAQSIAKQLNQLLAGLHASKIPVPTSVAVAAYTAAHGLSGPGNRKAMGGAWQVGRPGEAGADSVPMMIGDEPYMVAPGEIVAVINRHQKPDFDRRFADFGGLGGYFSKNKRPHNMATGGYVYPMPSSFHYGRTDMGVDGGAAVGAAFGGIGPGHVLGVQPNWYAGQPTIWWQLDSGPMSGQVFYLGEQVRPLVSTGSRTAGNKAIATFAPSGTGIEMGFGARYAVTQAQATGRDNGPGHDNTPAGQAFKAFLMGLSHGQIIDSGMMGASISAPHVKGPAGPYTTAVQKSLDMGANAANAWYQKKLMASGMLGGGFSGSFTSRGPTEDRIFKDLSRVGIHKVGIAGILGNAAQESGINPASRGSGGGGLWGFTPYPAGLPNDVDAQVAFMLNQWFGQDQGAVSGINSKKSPGDAAVYFEQTYEHAGNVQMANRIAFANEAFAAGYAKGGIVDRARQNLLRRHGHGHGRLTTAELARKYPHAWHFIKHISPGFPPQTLGSHWLDFLEHKSTWTPVKEGHLSQDYLNFFYKYLNQTQGQQIPKIQERASSISDLAGTHGPSIKQNREVVGLDRQAAALAIQGAHAIFRLQDAVARANKNKKKPPFPSAWKHLQNIKNTYLGISGRGGLVHDTEMTLLQQIQSAGDSGAHSQALIALLQQRNAQLREKLAVERAQYRAITGHGEPGTGRVAGMVNPILPFGGLMHNGGVIPGPPGMSVYMHAEAGERVVKRGEPGEVKVVIEPRRGAEKFVDARIEAHGRRISRRAGLTLPSRGGY